MNTKRPACVMPTGLSLPRDAHLQRTSMTAASRIIHASLRSNIARSSTAMREETRAYRPYHAWEMTGGQIEAHKSEIVMNNGAVQLVNDQSHCSSASVVLFVW